MLLLAVRTKIVIYAMKLGNRWRVSHATKRKYFLAFRAVPNERCVRFLYK